MNAKQKTAIIVAGGSGKRMGNDLPKQFMVIADLPILMHTINRFYQFDHNIALIVVLPESQHQYWKELIVKYNFKIEHKVTEGGIERFYSVLNGLKHCTPNSLVAIHDGVRPLVSKKTIENCYKTAEESGSAIPIISTTESIRKVNKMGSNAVNRSEYFMVQTPQVFNYEVLKKAYEQEYDCAFTDDASVVEKAGYQVALVNGNSENLKITRPMDLKIAEVLLQDYI